MNASLSSQDGLFEAATVHYDKETFRAAMDMVEHLRKKSEKLSPKKLKSLIDVEKAASARDRGEGDRDQKFARADGPVRGTEKGRKSIYTSITESNSSSRLAALAGEAEKEVRARAGKAKSSFFHPDAPGALKSLAEGDRIFLGSREGRKDRSYDVYKDCRVRKVKHPSRKAIVIVYEFDPNVMTLPFNTFKKLVGDDKLKPHSGGHLIAPERIDDILDGWLTA